MSENTLIAPPEGYVLVKKSDFKTCQKHLENLTGAVNSLKASLTIEMEKHISKAMKEAKAAPGSMASDKFNIESVCEKFEAECKRSHFKKSLETQQSEFKKKSLTQLSKDLSEGVNRIQKNAQAQIEKEIQNASDIVKNSLVQQNGELNRVMGDGIVEKYREAVSKELLPGMDVIYQRHCSTLYQHLTSHFSDIQRSNGTSRGVQEKITAIMHRVAALEQSTKNINLDPNFEERINSHISDIMKVQVQPVQEDISTQIANLIADQQYHEAIYKALCATDTEVLLSACRDMNVEAVFASSPPSATLLCLIHQMSEDLHIETRLKLSYIKHSVMCFSRKAMVDKSVDFEPIQLRTVVEGLQRNIDSHLQMDMDAMMIKMAAASLLQSYPMQ